jgi:hypothetical protein
MPETATIFEDHLLALDADAEVRAADAHRIDSQSKALGQEFVNLSA